MGLDGTFSPAQAQGIDADWPGYEKGGEEISKLKMNANLALFFFANEAENDLDLDSDWGSRVQLGHEQSWFIRSMNRKTIGYSMPTFETQTWDHSKLWCILWGSEWNPSSLLFKVRDKQLGLQGTCLEPSGGLR